MAHLSTTDRGEPRDSPVWFIWEKKALWIFGRDEDSFIKRLRQDKRCAVGIVDFDLQAGIRKHVGIRGESHITDIDSRRLMRFLSKYLGENQKQWNSWFLENIVNPLNKMVQVTPLSVVAKNVLYFKMGPYSA